MKFKRSLLALELGVLAPALSDSAKIPGLDCLWFDGETVSAYNDIIGIAKPFKTEFSGGVSGKILLGYLEKVDGEEVELVVEGAGEQNQDAGEEYQNLKISCGKHSRLKLPLSPIAERLWTLPEYESKGIVLTKDLLSLLSMSLFSVGKGAVDPECLGVTLESFKSDLHLFTTDAASLSWAQIPLPKGYSCDRITIPTEFCEQLLKLCSAEDMLCLSEECAIAENKAGTIVYGRILSVENPRDFRTVVSKHVTQEMINIPIGFESALDRACLLQVRKEPVLISLVSGTLGLFMATDIGELHDSLDVDGGSDGKLSVYFNPGLLKRALDERSLFALSKDSFVMRGPENFVHIVSRIVK